MVSMVTRSGLTLVGVGLVLGLPLEFLMFRGPMSMPDLSAADVGLAYLAGLSAALLVVAVLATVLPARRASGVAPATALGE